MGIKRKLTEQARESLLLPTNKSGANKENASGVHVNKQPETRGRVEHDTRCVGYISFGGRGLAGIGRFTLEHIMTVQHKQV